MSDDDQLFQEVLKLIWQDELFNKVDFGRVIDPQPNLFRIRGLVAISDGQDEWWPYQVDRERLRRDGPGTIAREFLDLYKKQRWLSQIPPDGFERVIKALQNPQLDWRTVSGIASEAGLTESQTQVVIDSLRSVLEQAKTQEGYDAYRLRPQGGGSSSQQLLWSYITKSSTSSST